MSLTNSKSLLDPRKTVTPARSITTSWLRSFFFFFSSRRRHTRLTCDWSSDVCSSDLIDGKTRRQPFLTLPWRGMAIAYGELRSPLAPGVFARGSARVAPYFLLPSWEKVARSAG